RLLDKTKSHDVAHIRYDEFRADEGCACASTGLWFQADRRLNEQYPNPNEFLLAPFKEGRISEVEAKASNYCKPTNPILPKSYVYASLAIGKIYEDSPLLSDGVAELEELRNRYLESNVDKDSYEYKRILDGLLNGYALSNDDLKMKKLTAEMLISNVVSDAVRMRDTKP
ncbi:MAG: hypothetical protein KJ717_14180, partial [Proteobacteria bacterium]|nr:hypothetical protein [Pseudomonadota bacterium]